MPARFVVVEGIDQSGKKTQTQLLLARVRKSGLRATALSFPVYTTSAGRQIRGFLSGRRQYSWEVLHMLYSLNRWENRERIVRALDGSDVVVADRYTASNLAYGIAHGLDEKWLKSLDNGLPEPRVVIILDVPVQSSFGRKRTKRDIHENDRPFLKRVRRAYLKLANEHGWHIVNGKGDPGDIHESVWKILRRILES